MIFGDMDAVVTALEDYPIDLVLHRGQGCGFIHLDSFPDVVTAPDLLWDRIYEFMDGKILVSMSGWHNASHITIERGPR